MALSARLFLAATLATSVASSTAAGSENASGYPSGRTSGHQALWLQEVDGTLPILASSVRPERIVHERAWTIDPVIPAVRLIEVCDESTEFMETAPAPSAASASDVVAALMSPTSNTQVLNDPHFNSVIDADIVTLATDQQSLFDLDLAHGLVVPIQDLSTRTLRFGLHLSLQRAF